MSENPPVVRPSPADLAFMDSAKIADMIAEGLAVLAERGDLGLLHKAQAALIGRWS